MWYDAEVNIKKVDEVDIMKINYELVPNNMGYLVILDYTSTINELEYNLSSIKEFAYGKVITVFDYEKETDNFHLNEIIGKWSDFSYMSIDEPTYKDFDKIQAEANILNGGLCNLSIVKNRKDGIFKALGSAKQGDIIIIKGKKHEGYQLFANNAITYTDKDAVYEYFHLMPKKAPHISKVS